VVPFVPLLLTLLLLLLLLLPLLYRTWHIPLPLLVLAKCASYRQLWCSMSAIHGCV
jgi:hypothetical protein